MNRRNLVFTLELEFSHCSILFLTFSFFSYIHKLFLRDSEYPEPKSETRLTPIGTYIILSLTSCSVLTIARFCLIVGGKERSEGVCLCYVVCYTFIVSMTSVLIGCYGRCLMDGDLRMCTRGLG